MIGYLNANAGAVTGIATIALLLVTGWYAWTTRALLFEAKQSRLLSNEPRVVAYLRVHETHSNTVQLCIANLSGAAATGVSVLVNRITAWPEQFDLQDSNVLRDLSFMRPHEVLKFDLGVGPDLFQDDSPAVFEAVINYASLDGRIFQNQYRLAVESVTGFANWQIYGMDDVARRLKEISDTLKAFTGINRLKVETYDTRDREEERRIRDAQRETFMRRQNPPDNPESD